MPKVIPGVLINELEALSVSGPDTVTALADELVNAPPEDTPVPATVALFSKLKPLRSIAPPLLTVTLPVPNALLVIAPTVPTEATPIFKVPADTVVPPEYVLAPDKVNTPEPDLLRVAPDLVSAVAHVTF